MASNPLIPCGPCAYESTTNVAIKWCTQCEEGFCRDCEKSHRSLKLTRDHKMITIEDYLKIQDVSVDLTCKTHGKKLDLFWKYHGVAKCAVCVPSAHKTCQAEDIISIDDAAENAKSSAGLTELEKTISRTLENGQTTGCLITSDGRIFITDFWETGKLVEYDDRGEYVRDVQKKSKAFDITEINTDRIAVTYPNWNCIEIFNIKEITVESKIGCKSRCYGLSQYKGNIFTIMQDHGILMMDLAGTILQTINIDIHSSVYFITVTDDKLYYTDESRNTVNCCNLAGEKIWIFENRFIDCPSGLTVDKNQNVYVSGLKSHNLTLIQHNGKQSKEICNASDDLCAPLAVCYNKTNNSLLLGYKTNYIALYQVS
ncbi:Hypothetical predicted protein [Mytilus galloprovincialis]|uniref:B box-type domain-containing protein n=1 Tax=Mytilus galloprovincialis TaxID=29158 RepID=A0A8B6DZA3_MYTGA|nr:Hypothetical predicted protein [Mytilus galloprovincialis]